MATVKCVHVMAVALLSVADWACSGASCDGAMGYSIRARVRDANTGKEMCNVKAVAHDGNDEWQLTCWGPPECSCAGVPERLGTYELTVTAPGYQDSTSTVVVDTKDECRVHTESVTVKLSPL